MFTVSPLDGFSKKATFSFFLTLSIATVGCVFFYILFVCYFVYGTRYCSLRRFDVCSCVSICRDFIDDVLD